jgi:hypothetical protein
MLCALAAWLALRAIGGPRDGHAGPESRRMHFHPLATWLLAILLMLGFTLAWQVDGMPPMTPATAELGLLGGATRFRPVAYDYRQAQFHASSEVLLRARVKTERRRRPAPAGALLYASGVPAGLYQAQALLSGPAEGTLTLRVGATPIAMWSASLSDARSHAVGPPIRLPVDVDSIVVEGDELARRRVIAVELQAVSVPASRVLPQQAMLRTTRRAVPYGSVQAYFLDDLAYPEPSGFWIAGGRRTDIMLADYGQGRDFVLRNAPVDNTVTIEIGGQRREIALRPNEETTIHLPGSPAGPDAWLRLHSRMGVRPSQLDPSSGDMRYLSCWVQIR